MLLISYGTTNGKCHRNVQKPGPKPGIKHGTAKGYAYYGCRCPECRKAAYATKCEVDRGDK